MFKSQPCSIQSGPLDAFIITTYHLALNISVDEMVRIRTNNTPPLLKEIVGELSALFGTHELYAQWMDELDAFSDRIRSHSRQKQIEALDAIVHVHHQVFAEWLGYNVVALIGPAELTPARLVEIVNLDADILIDNWHLPIGRVMEEHGVRYASLINFPGVEATETLLHVLEYNAKQLGLWETEDWPGCDYSRAILMLRRVAAMSLKLSKRYFFTIFIICATFFILAIGITHRINERVLVEQIHLNNLSRLGQASAAFDLLHLSIIPSMVQLLENGDVQLLVYSSRNENIQVLDSMKILRQARLSNPIIESILAYNMQLERIYTTGGWTGSVQDFADPEILALFDNATGNDLYRYIPRTQAGQNLLTVLVGYHPVDSIGLVGGLLVNISERSLRNLYFRDFFDTAGNITIVDPSGTVITDSNQQNFGALVPEGSFLHPRNVPQDPSGTFLSRHQGKKVLVSYTRNQSMDWLFFLVSPYEIQTRTLSATRNAILLIVVPLLGLLFAGVWFVAHRLARPVEKLVDITNRINNRFFSLNSQSLNLEQSGDSIMFVNSTLKVMEKQLTELNTIHDNYHSMQSCELFRILLEGNIPDIKSLEIPWISDTSMYCIVALKGFSFPYQGDQVPSEYLDMVSAGLPGVVVSTLAQSDIVVLLWDCDREKIDSIFPYIDQLALDGIVLPDKLVYGISSISCLQDVSLGELYRQALAALSLQFRGTGKKVYSYDQVCLVDTSYCYPDETVARILNEVKSEHPQNAVKILTEALDEVSDYAFEDFSYFVQTFLYDIYNCLVPTGFLSTATILQLQNFRRDIDWFTTVQDVHRTVTEIFSEYSYNRSHSGDSRRQEIISAVQKTIDQNYQDPNLSPKTIASELNLSVNYLRRIFKEQYKNSVSDCITRKRIDYCCGMLQQTSLPVKEIYLQAGFLSYNYFFDTFKKSTGFTPGEYRKHSGLSCNSE